jgi:hexosaminidase
MAGIERENMEKAEAAINAAMRNVQASKMQRPDADLIKSEFENAAAMLRFACRKASGEDQKEQLEQIVQNHRQCWLARNRPGGLEDSIGRLITNDK